MYREVTDEVLHKVIILLRNDIDLTSACFVFSISIWQVIPKLRVVLKDEHRLYTKAVKPLLIMFRQHGISLQKTADLFEVARATVERACLNEEQLATKREKEKNKAKERLKNNPELRKKQNIAGLKYYYKKKEKEKEYVNES